jgi:hypothetical protein
MRLFFILLLLAVLRASALAQGQPVQIWQAVEYVQNINVKGPVIALDRFQNTYMLTNQTDESPFSGFTLVKYDTLGNALWKRHSQISIIGALYGSFTVDSTGNAYVGQWQDGGLPGYDADALLIKYAPDGTKAWEANYGLGQAGDSYIYHSEMDTLHGRLITLGMNLHDTLPGENFLFVQAVDTADGSVAWRTKIPGVFRPQNLRVQAGHIQLLSTWYKPDSKYFVNTLVDFEGNVTAHYEKPYSGYAIDFNFISKTGDVIFGNRAFGYNVTRVDVHGDTLWRYEYPDWNQKNWVRGVVEDDSLNVYATGATQIEDDISSFTTIKLKDGVVLWEDFGQLAQNNFSTGNNLSVYKGLLSTAGASKVMSDSTKMTIKIYNSYSGEDLFQISLCIGKVNSAEYIFSNFNTVFFTGYAHDNMTNSVSIISGVFRLPKISVNTVNLLDKSFFHLFPNPTVDKIVISNIDLKNFDNLVVYSASGEVAIREKIVQTVEELSLSNLPSGSYVVSLQGKNACISKKIIKM